MRHKLVTLCAHQDALQQTRKRLRQASLKKERLTLLTHGLAPRTSTHRVPHKGVNVIRDELHRTVAHRRVDPLVVFTSRGGPSVGGFSILDAWNVDSVRMQ